MTTDDRRTALLEAKTVNGVDFVEVDPTNEAVLNVHFVLNLPDSPTDPVPAGASGDALTARNFSITGGERITSIGIVSAVRSADDQMQVVVSQVGDFSVYTLNLTDAHTATGIPVGFDPASASANFVFHIDCAKDFDCAATTSCTTEAVTPPPINYLAKDYPGFRQVMLDRLNLLAPRWQERNAADIGVAVVEMLAYVADQLSYRQDVIATEAYLGTARLRTSARRHARLVDYVIGEGCNSRVWMRVFLGAGATDGIVLPEQTRCATAYPGAVVPTLPHETLAYRQAINGGAVFFETVAASDGLSASLGEMPLYAWSESQSCLSIGATHATLDGAFPLLIPGMVVVLAEVKGPLTGDASDADPSHRQAVRLAKVMVTQDPLTSRPVTEVDWYAEDALTFPLCVSSVTDATHMEQSIDGVSVAWGNIVLADQGRRTGGPTDPLSTGPEMIGVVPGQGRFRPSLANAPLTFAAPLPEAGQPAIAAVGPLANPVPVVALSSVEPEVTPAAPSPWVVSPDLLEAGIGPDTPVFVPEIETDGTAYLLFGDGISGQLPVVGSSFVATYRVGNGTAGNVARESVVLFDPSAVPDGVTGVSNPLPAWGGVDPETIDSIRQSAPVAFRTQERAVTAADYQERAMQYPGVMQAAATLRWTGSWYTVFLTIERDQQAALDAEFIDGLEAYLDGFRMAGFDLQVEDGIQVPLFIQMSVCVQSDYVATDIEQTLLGVFSPGLQPNGSLGLFNPDLMNLGQPFYLSPIIAAAQAVDGVSSVQIVRFERQDQPGDAGLLAGVLVPQRLEFFVLYNDPNYPERGTFELTVEGGI